MILKVYDTSHKYLGLIDNPISLKIETSLKTGTKTLSFSLPLVKEMIEIINTEGYIETVDYSYIIKEIEMKNKTTFNVYCQPNIEELTGSILPVFDVHDVTPSECINEALIQGNTGWTTNFHVNYPNIVQYVLRKVTVLECLNKIKEDFEYEYLFDTKNKRIEVYAAGGIGTKKGNMLMNELRLASLSFRGETYDFATVLYPYGKKGITIKDVNNNKEYLENHTYCDKDIVAYFIDESIEYADDLKKIATDYLKQISTPIETFRVQTTHLPPNLTIGDTIYVIDNIKRKKTIKRVVKITQYPNQPEKDTIELDNEVENISKMFYQFQDSYRKKIRYIEQNISELQ